MANRVLHGIHFFEHFSKAKRFKVKIYGWLDNEQTDAGHIAITKSAKIK
jgi:hypothetical protein